VEVKLIGRERGANPQVVVRRRVRLGGKPRPRRADRRTRRV